LLDELVRTLAEQVIQPRQSGNQSPWKLCYDTLCWQISELHSLKRGTTVREPGARSAEYGPTEDGSVLGKLITGVPV